MTVTHAEITRFFMTIPEDVSLVLQAGAHGFSVEEERGNIYRFDMGQPVKIIDLARQMIRLAGARPGIDIKIIGLRPGEKLYEEVMHSAEAILPTRSKSILKLAPRTLFRALPASPPVWRVPVLSGVAETRHRLSHDCRGTLCGDARCGKSLK